MATAAAGGRRPSSPTARLVGARPAEGKKGADQGIDGKLYFLDAGKPRQVVISVKAGHTGRAHVHELRGVVDREQAAIGVLISMQAPTKAMREEAASAGFRPEGLDTRGLAEE